MQTEMLHSDLQPAPKPWADPECTVVDPESIGVQTQNAQSIYQLKPEDLRGVVLEPSVLYMFQN